LLFVSLLLLVPLLSDKFVVRFAVVADRNAAVVADIIVAKIAIIAVLNAVFVADIVAAVIVAVSVVIVVSLLSSSWSPKK